MAKSRDRFGSAATSADHRPNRPSAGDYFIESPYEGELLVIGFSRCEVRVRAVGAGYAVPSRDR